MFVSSEKQSYKEKTYIDDICSKLSIEKEEHGHEEEHKETGTIGTFDFYIWSFIPAIGILFCILHSEQEYLWKWTGNSTEEAQSLQAKVVVSVMSTVIGACVAATMMKAFIGISFTLMRYRGVNFSQLVTMIGGYSLSHIPMLTAGKSWLSILVVILIVAGSTITKQLAVVSMGVTPNIVKNTTYASIRNYSTCDPVLYAAALTARSVPINMNSFNSLRNPNVSFTNEYYDRSIPSGLQGVSNFNRVLPFVNVSCIPVPARANFTRKSPVMSTFPRWLKVPTKERLATTVMTLPLYDDNNSASSIQWVNCSIMGGYATASTRCNNTLCETNRISKIEPYTNASVSTAAVFRLMFENMNPKTTNVRNVILTWLLGGNITDVYNFGEGVPGQNIETIQKRAEIMGTVVMRVLCDQTVNSKYKSTNFETYYETFDSFTYEVLWKWPFYLISSFILVSWIVCMATMWISPESRIMSVEWLLNQYIARDNWSYLSGQKLVEMHQGALFQIKDQKSEEDIGNITILKKGKEEATKSDQIRRDKQYR